MAVFYKVVSKRPGGMAGTNAPRYYPVLTDRRVMDLRELSKRISDMSTVSRPDVMAVVYAFIDLIPGLLQDGYNIKLDGFGTFSLHVSGEGKDDPDQVTHRDIKGVKMTILPDKRIKIRLQATTFRKKQTK